MNTRSLLLSLSTACTIAGCDAASPSEDPESIASCDDVAPAVVDLRVQLVDEADDPLAPGHLVALWIGALEIDAETSCETAPLYAEVLGDIDEEGVAAIDFVERPPPGVAGGWQLSPIGLFVWVEYVGAEFGAPSGLTSEDAYAIADELSDVSMAFVLATDGATKNVGGPLDGPGDLAFPGADYVKMSDTTLLQLPRGFAADSVMGRLFGGAVGPGYHLLQWSAEDDLAYEQQESMCMQQAATPGERFTCAAKRFRQGFTLVDPEDIADVRMGPVDPEALSSIDAGGSACD